MKNNKTIEAEGGEIIIKNTAGDVAIIPRNKRAEVINALNNDYHDDVDNIVSGLPKMSDYAEDGTVYPGDPPKAENGNPPPEFDLGFNTSVVDKRNPINRINPPVQLTEEQKSAIENTKQNFYNEPASTDTSEVEKNELDKFSNAEKSKLARLKILQEQGYDIGEVREDDPTWSYGPRARKAWGSYVDKLTEESNGLVLLEGSGEVELPEDLKEYDRFLNTPDIEEDIKTEVLTPNLEKELKHFDENYKEQARINILLDKGYDIGKVIPGEAKKSYGPKAKAAWEHYLDSEMKSERIKTLQKEGKWDLGAIYPDDPIRSYGPKVTAAWEQYQESNKDLSINDEYSVARDIGWVINPSVIKESSDIISMNIEDKAELFREKGFEISKDNLQEDVQKAQWDYFRNMQMVDRNAVMRLKRLTPEEQHNNFGITLEQSNQMAISYKYRKRFAENVAPRNYDMDEFKAALLDDKRSERRDQYDAENASADNKARADALRLSTGFPQKHGMWKPSKYKPTRAKDKDAIYYEAKDHDNVARNLLRTLDETLAWKEEHPNNTLQTGYLGGSISSLGPHGVDIGYDKEKKLNYIVYTDTYDYMPSMGTLYKPFNVYGRVYYRGNKEDGYEFQNEKGDWEKFKGSTSWKAAERPFVKGILARGDWNKMVQNRTKPFLESIENDKNYSDFEKKVLKGTVQGAASVISKFK
jgi:hypothetical protein